MQRRQFMTTLAGVALTPMLSDIALANTNTVKVIVFPGAQNLSMWVALEKGFFKSKDGFSTNCCLNFWTLAKMFLSRKFSR